MKTLEVISIIFLVIFLGLILFQQACEDFENKRWKNPQTKYIDWKTYQQTTTPAPFSSSTTSTTVPESSSDTSVQAKYYRDDQHYTTEVIFALDTRPSLVKSISTTTSSPVTQAPHHHDQNDRRDHGRRLPSPTSTYTDAKLLPTQSWIQRSPDAPSTNSDPFKESIQVTHIQDMNDVSNPTLIDRRPALGNSAVLPQSFCVPK